MAGDKVFPKPRSSGNYREPSTPSDPAIRITAPKIPTVVTRAEPPREEEEENSSGENPKLSQDEIKALLAVHTTNGRTQTRNRLIFAAFPALFVSIIADKLFGLWGIPVTLAFSVLWALWPMRKQDREGW